MTNLLIAIALLVLGCTSVSGQTAKPISASDLAAYAGADRERVLFDGAKREGKVVWYTTLAADQNKQIAALFEKKYPGVSVEIYRTGASALAQRLLTEAKARRHIADAVETTPPGLMTFRDSQLLLPYASPYLASFPDDAKEKAPRNQVYWTRSEEHTSELQSPYVISYAVFCLKKK